MIHGSKLREIESFCYIDRCGEGLGVAKPKEGQKFIGYPYQWFSEYTSCPFISIVENGVEIQTVNALDCSFITFKQEAESE